jgi:hypothetical protein
MHDAMEKPTECSSCKTANEPGGRRKVDDGMLFPVSENSSTGSRTAVKGADLRQSISSRVDV